MNIAKPDETQKMFRRNYELLTPELKNAVSAVSEEEYAKKIEVTYNVEGLPVCLYRKEGVRFHITSEHPAEEAKAWGQSVKLQDAAEIFLYGCGFGYTLFELFEQKPPHALVMVFESDICLFKSMLYYFDLSPLFQTQKIVFFAGDETRQKYRVIDLFGAMLFDAAIVPTVIFSLSAARHFKREYLQIHRRVFEDLSFIASSIGNSHLDDLKGLRNLLRNTIHFLKCPYIGSLKDKCKGAAAVIVSNGPSLDKSIPLLKRIQGRCLMLCAESAIVPLSKNGIRPDIMVSLERTKANYLYHFKNHNHSPEITLLASGMVDPRVFDSFSGEKLPVFRSGEGLSRWFNAHLGDGSELEAGASSAHLAMCAAMHLGADPIIFVGQDLAYGADGATHSKDAVSMQEEGKRIRDIIRSFPVENVEGNDGKMIPSNRVWISFRYIMENIISRHPEHHFYNATEGGAKIQGTQRAMLSELTERYCTKPLACRINELVAKERKKIPSEERSALLDNMIEDISRYAVLFRELSREANNKKLECERMMLLCGGKDEAKYQYVLDRTYKSNLDLIYGYRQDALCAFFTQRLLCVYFYLFNRLGAVDTQEKRAQIFELHRQFFRNLRVIAQSLAVTFEEALPLLNDARRELYGKEARE